MALLTFGGLASGLDTNAIISSLLQAERIPITQLETRQKELSAAKDAISSLSSKMASIKSAAQALSTSVGFASYKAGSSDASVVATVSGSAAPGAYALSVTKLAKEQRTYSDTQASSTAALGMSGSLSLQVGSGSTVTLTIESTDSLTDIATKIGSSGARVGASVIFDGSQYRLQVRGLDSGAANVVNMTETGFSLGLLNPANTLQPAQDAQFTVDGIPMTRSTNQVSGVIPGITLALTKEGISSNITVESDPEGLKKKVQAFVTAYNDVVNAGHSMSGYGTSKASVKELSGDSAIRTSLDRLARIISTPVTGTSGKYTTLGSIGLTTDRDGKLKLDETKLSAALTADPTSVAKLFVEDSAIGATGAMKSFMTAIDQLAQNEGSTLKSRLDVLGKLSTRLEDDIAAGDRRMAMYENQLRERFAQLEVIVSKYKTQGTAVSNMAASGGTT